MKKVLILSASTGAGHVRAGEALLATANIHAPDAEVRHIDIADLLSAPARNIIIESYNKLAGRWPNAWGWLYEKTRETKYRRSAAWWPRLFHRMDGSPIQKTVDQFRPDCILATHFFPSIFLESDVPIATIVTDYAVHPLWLMGNPKTFFVSTEEMKREAIAFGVTENHIHISGIPIHPSFYDKAPVEKTSTKGGPASGGKEKNILALAGGYGLNRIDRMVKQLFQLPEPTKIISIAGKNKRLEDALSRLAPPAHIRHTVIGWTDAIQTYMRMADMIIGKPGGLTTTECVALQKPLIAIDPIPGHEDANVRYLTTHGYGILAKNLNEILLLVQQHPDILAPGYKNRPPSEAASSVIWRTVLTGH